jgi:nucleoside-diphosphate-sugar epimerase
MADTVLITGATGMLGHQLLPKLCAEAQVEKVIVLARKKSPAFSHWKIEVLRGDVSHYHLGLDPLRRQTVHSMVTIIIHGAAETSFSSELETAREINVTGTANLLRLAAGCPRLRALCHLSTVYVAGQRKGVIGESALAENCGFVNAYEQSKWETEQLLQSHADKLPISIIRLSTIFGDSQDGVVSKLGAIHHALRFFFHSLAPFVPGTAESPVDLISLDYAAASTAALALQRFVPGTWHICGGTDSLSLAEMLDLTLQLFYTWRPAWRKRAIEKPAIVDLKTFELFVKSVEEVGESTLKDSVAVLKHFAPQLAYPKQFEDGATRALLENMGVVKPAIRNYYPKVVRFLLENEWKAAPCAQLVL